MFEFLITVNELCEQNYPADSVEVALVFNSEKAKVMFYICWFVTDEFLILFSQIGGNALTYTVAVLGLSGRKHVKKLT